MFLCCFQRRRPSVDAATMSRNPFQIDLVIQMMLEEAGVDILKTLREMNTNWNKLDLKELEKRSMNGQLKELTFSDRDQKRLDEFLESSSSNPQLFHSFCLDFPNSFKFIGSSTSKYSPIFFHLKFKDDCQFTDLVTRYLINIFKWIAPTLQELTIERVRGSSALESVFTSHGASLVFQKLTKLSVLDVSVGPAAQRSYFIPFQFILDRSGVVDPTPNLTTLEACINRDFLEMMNNGPNLTRWSQLTILRIFKCRVDDVRFTTTLLSLGQAGMRLKAFSLCYTFFPLEGSPEICENWSKFFETQSKSLEVLKLDWIFCKEDAGERVDPKINLPIFERLKTLHLILHYNVRPIGGPVQIWMFKNIQIPLHFPKLDHLHVNYQGFFNMFPLDGEPISLKSLEIQNFSSNLQAWTWCTFPPSLDALKCEESFFRNWWTRMPWRKCLKVLEIDCVSFPLNVSHFTSLRVLTIRRWDIWTTLPSDYLSFFQQVLALNLSSIIFKSWKEPSDEVKTRFIRYFPFPVKFEPMTS